MARIIAGYAGVGKTTLAKKYKNVLDLESTPYKYFFENYKALNAEAMKGNHSSKTINPDFPDNYIKAIKDNMDKYDYLLVWCHAEQTFPHYDRHGIDYEIFLPEREILDEYKQRFINRGNVEEYVNRVSDKEGYDVRLSQYKATGKPIIFLKAGETLESYFKNNKDYPPLLAID